MRNILILLTVLTLLLASVSFAENSPEPSFQESFQDWLHDLNLDQKDYNLVLKTQSNAYQAAIRKSNVLYEIELGKMGTLQLSSESMVFYSSESGQTYAFPYRELISPFCSLISSTELEKDSSVLSKYAVKFWADVISPSINFQMTWRGFSGSIDINDRDLANRITSFVDDILSDREFSERLLTRYGSVLRILSIPIPDSLEDIRAAWQQERSRFVSDVYSFRLKAEFTFIQDFNGTSFTLFGNIETLYNDVIPFEFTADFTREVWSIHGSVLDSQMQTTLHLYGTNNTWSGSANLFFPGSYANQYSLDIQGEGYQYNAELHIIPPARYNYKSSQPDHTVFRAYANYDPELKKITGQIVQVIENPEPKTKELLALDANLMQDSISASLTFPEQTVEIAFRNSPTALHATADIIQGTVTNHISLILNHFGKQYTVHAVYSVLSNWRLLSNYSIDLNWSSSSFNLEFSLPNHQSFRVRSVYTPEEDGYDLDFYLTSWTRVVEGIKEMDNPVSMKLQKHANGIHLELNNIFQNRNMQDSTVVDFQFDGTEVTKASGSMMRAISPFNTDKICFEYLPSSLELITNDNRIHILKERETEQEIVFRIQQDRKPELLHLTVAFDEAEVGKALLLTLNTPAEEVLTCQIVPVYKSAPASIDESKAIIFHDPVQFFRILMALWQSQSFDMTANDPEKSETTRKELSSPDPESMRTVLVRGYSSIITVQTEVADNTIKALTISAPDEDPGHGKWIEEPEFAEQFLNRTLPIAEDSIDCISGATLSSQAIIRALNLLKDHGPESVFTGFFGNITVYADILSNRVMAISVKAPYETENLGKMVESPEYLRQFVGRWLPLTPEKFDTVSGATESSTAVIHALNALCTNSLESTVNGFSGVITVQAVLDGATVRSLKVSAPDESDTGRKVEDLSFTSQFIGKALCVPDNEIDLISGATISSMAVVDALNALAENNRYAVPLPSPTPTPTPKPTTYVTLAPILSISNLHLTSNSSYKVCTGTVTNSGNMYATYVKVKASFKDSSGNVLDTDWTYAVGSEKLSPGESKTFRLSVPYNRRINSVSVWVEDYR